MTDNDQIGPTIYIPTPSLEEPKSENIPADISSSISRSKMNSPFIDNIGGGSMTGFFEREKEAKEADQLVADTVRKELLSHKHKKKKIWFILVFLVILVVIVGLLAYLYLSKSIII